jgi:hypothetical protein
MRDRSIVQAFSSLTTSSPCRHVKEESTWFVFAQERSEKTVNFSAL